MNRVDRHRLNAPEDFNWTDEDVIFEKNQSLLNGLCLGLIIGFMLMVILVG